MARIIALSGPARSGKDTIAARMCSEYGFQQAAFADPIRYIVKEVFRPTEEQLYWNREEPLEAFPEWTVRTLLQFIGTELFRQRIDEEIWVKSLLLKLRQQPGEWVVSDIRFPNELEGLRTEFGDDFHFVYVHRPETDDVGIPGHASEAHYGVLRNQADTEIINDGTLEELERSVDMFVAVKA